MTQFYSVRAIKVVKNNGVNCVPGDVNTQDFVVDSTTKDSLLALGYITVNGTANAPVSSVPMTAQVDSNGVAKGLDQTSNLALAAAMSNVPAQRLLSAMRASYEFQASNPTMAAADVPTVFGQILFSKSPATDTLDPATKLVTLTGDAASLAYSPNIALTAVQKAIAFQWVSGINKGLKFVWNYVGVLGAGYASGDVGNAAVGSIGNNYDATTNPNGAVFPISLAEVYDDRLLVGDLLYVFVPNNSLFKIYINGVLLTVAPTLGATYQNLTLPGTLAATNSYLTDTGGGGWIKIKWATVARRWIRVVLMANTGPSNFYIKPTQTCVPAFPVKATHLHIGDSFSSGSTPAPVQCAVASRMAELMGPRFDFVNDSMGGSGFGSGITFLSRLNSSLAVVQTPASISILAGKNDTAAQITANAPTFLAALRAKFPFAGIHVSLNYSTTDYATAAAKEAALAAACATVPNCVYTPSYGVSGNTPLPGISWLYGSGSQTVPTGDGNADSAMGGNGGDVTHPSPFGALYVWADNMVRSMITNYATGAIV